MFFLDIFFYLPELVFLYLLSQFCTSFCCIWIFFLQTFLFNLPTSFLPYLELFSLRYSLILNWNNLPLLFSHICKSSSFTSFLFLSSSTTSEPFFSLVMSVFKNIKVLSLFYTFINVLLKDNTVLIFALKLFLWGFRSQ